MSHSDRVAFLPLALINQSIEVRKRINKERWRWTWHYQSGDKEAIFRPTEDEALANIFLETRGRRGRN